MGQKPKMTKNKANLATIDFDMIRSQVICKNPLKNICVMGHNLANRQRWLRR